MAGGTLLKCQQHCLLYTNGFRILPVLKFKNLRTFIGHKSVFLQVFGVYIIIILIAVNILKYFTLCQAPSIISKLYTLNNPLNLHSTQRYYFHPSLPMRKLRLKKVRVTFPKPHKGVSLRQDSNQSMLALDFFPHSDVSFALAGE